MESKKTHKPNENESTSNLIESEAKDVRGQNKRFHQ